MSEWRSAFSELVRTRGAALMQYAYLLCGDTAQAPDLVQEALLRTFSRVRVGSVDIDRLESYVRRTILNITIDQARRDRRWQSTQHLVLAPVYTDGDAGETIANAVLVRQSLALLSPMQRASIVLRFYEDLSLDQIAAELGCSVGAVKRHLSDARSRLRPLLEETKGGAAS